MKTGKGMLRIGDAMRPDRFDSGRIGRMETKDARDIERTLSKSSVEDSFRARFSQREPFGRHPLLAGFRLRTRPAGPIWDEIGQQMAKSGVKLARSEKRIAFRMRILVREKPVQKINHAYPKMSHENGA